MLETGQKNSFLFKVTPIIIYIKFYLHNIKTSSIHSYLEQKTFCLILLNHHLKPDFLNIKKFKRWEILIGKSFNKP